MSTENTSTVIEVPKINKRFALICCGGGAAGPFQAGVLQAMTEGGLTSQTSLMSGTSVGALNVGIYSMFSHQDQAPFAKSVWDTIKTNKDVYLGSMEGISLVGGVIGALAGSKSMLDRKPLKDKLKKIFGGMTIGDLSAIIPCHAVMSATNLNTKKVEFFNTWDTRFKYVTVADALGASSGIPGAFDSISIQIQGRLKPNWYVDGGLGANNPFLAVTEYNRLFPDTPIEKAIIIYCYPENIADVGIDTSVPDDKDYSKCKDAALASIPAMMNTQEQMIEKTIESMVALGGIDVLAMWPEHMKSNPLDFSHTKENFAMGYNYGKTGMGESYRDKAPVHILDFLKRD